MRSTFRMEDEYITMTRGDTLSFGMEVKDDTGNGIELDTAYMTCKKALTDDVNVFLKSLGNGITEIGDGQYAVRVAPEDTANVSAGKYFYDLQIGVNGDIFTVKKGVLELEADITY